MFKLYKNYLKSKLISLLKDKLIEYLNEKNKYSQRTIEWKNKKYNNKCMTEEYFEKTRQGQILYSNEKYSYYCNREETMYEVIRIIESL